ncbi:MAG: molecular chaperone DnaJ [Defluviitaleaceae bacterium]|nr:molecular chaperone DnaJ [Defluviitaleaceae bacterium]
MADKKDYYETLQVSKQATDSELKSAYRKLAKKYHPDENPGDDVARERFKEVGEAYAILSDADKRAAYDQFGHAAFDPASGGGGGGFYGNMNFDVNDIFNSFFGGSDIFGNSRRRSGPRRGADLQMRMTITLEEAVFGATREIQLPTHETCKPCGGSGAKAGTHPETCKECSGTGQVRRMQQTMLGSMTTVSTCSACRGEGKIIKEPCPSCRGNGKVRVEKTLSVTVPKGIDTGQSIRLPSKGEPGEKGGPDGDLLIVMQIQPHKVFARQGNNLYLDVPITFVQAALGDEIAVPLLDGTEERYQIKAGTQPGSLVSLKNKGVPSVRNNRNVGDLVVTLNVSVPTKLTDKQKEYLQAFNNEMGDEYINAKKSWLDKIKGMMGK